MINFTDQLLQSMLDEVKHRDDEHQQTINKVLDNTYLVTKTPWLRFNKWEHRFANEDMKELHALTDLPNATETTETIIVNMVDTIGHECWDGYHDCLNRNWDLLPFWLGSVARDKESTKPFRSYIAPYTLTRYIEYWQGYILMCYRMYDQHDSRVEFTVAQKALLADLQILLNDYTEDQADVLRQILFDLSVALIMHSDYAKASSSLTYYTGIRGYNVDYKQWRQPQDYTTILAGLQFCIRIIMLEYAVPTASRNTFTEHSVITPIDKFCQIRNKWLIDGGGISVL